MLGWAGDGCNITLYSSSRKSISFMASSSFLATIQQSSLVMQRAGRNRSTFLYSPSQPTSTCFFLNLWTHTRSQCRRSCAKEGTLCNGVERSAEGSSAGLNNQLCSIPPPFQITRGYCATSSQHASSSFIVRPNAHQMC